MATGQFTKLLASPSSLTHSTNFTELTHSLTHSLSSASSLTHSTCHSTKLPHSLNPAPFKELPHRARSLSQSVDNSPTSLAHSNHGHYSWAGAAALTRSVTSMTTHSLAHSSFKSPTCTSKPSLTELAHSLTRKGLTRNEKILAFVLFWLFVPCGTVDPLSTRRAAREAVLRIVRS